MDDCCIMEDMCIQMCFQDGAKVGPFGIDAVDSSFRSQSRAKKLRIRMDG